MTADAFVTLLSFGLILVISAWYVYDKKLGRPLHRRSRVRSIALGGASGSVPLGVSGGRQEVVVLDSGAVPRKPVAAAAAARFDVDLDEEPEPVQLPAGLFEQLGQPMVTEEAGPRVVAIGDWLPWAVGAYHLLLAGSTGTGKSTTAEVIMQERARRGDHFVILDPHWSPRLADGSLKWGGIRPAAIQTGDIRKWLGVLRAEYDRRLGRLHRGDVAEGCFEPRITVLVDETPEVYEALGDLWKDTGSKLGAGARKVNISVILLTQSVLVQDIGLNTSMRKNYTRIALGDEVPALLREENDKKRKDALFELLRGREYPAALFYKSQVHVLDRQGLRALRPSRIEAPAWVPNPADYGHTGMEVPKVPEKTGSYRSHTSMESAMPDMDAENPHTAGHTGMDKNHTGMAWLAGLGKAEKVEALVVLGVSANAIANVVGGDRNAVLTLVRELRGGEE